MIVAAWLLLKDRSKVQIALTPAARVQVAVGGAVPVKAVVSKLDGAAVDSLSRRVRFTIDDSAIARVTDSGAVRGLKVGTTVLTASLEKLRKTLEVEVVAALVSSLTIAPAQLNLTVGGRGRLVAVPRDPNGNVLRRDIMWTSSNPTVAAVAGDGQIIASDTGIATIMANSEGRMANAVVTVKPSAAMIAAAKAAGAGGDCQAYDPAALRVVRDRNAGFLLTDGTNTLLTLDDELDSQQAMQLARGYKSHCYLGRTNRRPNRSNFVIEYWINSTGAPIVIANEDCERYTPSQLRVVENAQQGFRLMDGRRVVLDADSREDAQKIWEVAQQHTAQCFIGRGNNRPNKRDYVVQYWR
jgi:hypothetical protein